MKSVVVLVIVGLLGCNPKPTVITGGLMVGGGIIMVATAPAEDGKFHLFGSAHENAVDAGGFFIVTGLVVALIGAVQYGLQNSEQEKLQASAGIAAPPAPFPVTTEPPPEFVDPADAPDSRPVPGIKEPPLPAESLMFDNPSQRQFAVQASSAARRGRCIAAIASGKQLTVENDQKLLAADAAYAKCVASH